MDRPHIIYSRKTGRPCKSRSAARRNAPPGVVRIARVTGGYMAYYTMTDYLTARNQR